MTPLGTPNLIVAVIGLGYVGLPLAIEFGRKYPTIGFDLSQTKVDAYNRFIDPTGEVGTDDLRAVIKTKTTTEATQAPGLECTTDPRRLASADFLIVAVPTPVDQAHIPDFGPLIGASTLAGQHMKKGATIVYESTVYPGATEEVCIPVLEKYSGMRWACRSPSNLAGISANVSAETPFSLPFKGRAGEGMGENAADTCPIPHLTSPLKGEEQVKLAHMPRGGDACREAESQVREASRGEGDNTFNVGYSPERINPGDKEHTLTKILKVVSGDSAETLDKVATLYGSIITAGVHKATSIKVAEAAKVIENTQRDLNIALMNELAIVFNKIGIDTAEVLEAAGTKWNFLKFKPGLVGGHCIGVDPYYLTHKAEMLGYHPQVILAGRRINDGMASYIAKMTVQGMINQGACTKGDTVIVLGLTFKEDCPDLRNSKVADVISSFKTYGLNVVINDPLADPDEAFHEYGIELTPWEKLPRNASAVVAAVSHKHYLQMPLSEILALLKPGGVFTDIKSAFDAATIEQAGCCLWRL